MCEKRCHDACIRKECDVNGTCLYGCSNGKYGIECDQNCPEGCRFCYSASECSKCNDGYYGEICQHLCHDNCKVCHDNVSCDACKMGWTNQSKTCKTSKLGCSDVPHICAFCDHGFYGNQCEEKCEHCINATCDDVGKCDIACKPNTNATKCEALKGSDGTDPSPEFLIIAIVLLLVTLITAVIVIIYLKIKRKVRRVKPQEDQLTVHLRNGLVAENNELSLYNIRGSQALLTELDPEEDIEEIIVPVIENHNYLNVKISRIFVNSLWEFTLKNKANDYLKEEFRGLPEGLLLECRVAKKTGNKKLNRYKHIYPYDTTRFVLNFENGNKAGDYINASYVNGLENPREYIAAQGPFTDDTIKDFWRMIWQSKANTIIILTNLEENKIMKCKKYWPKSEITYGDFHIEIETEESSPLFTVRRFNLNKEGEERTIEQFHFTAWPDKGVPKDVNSILEFRNRFIRKTDISGPLVVHCSAGIGRTGSFIAIDYLIKQGQRDGSVDVVSCVSRLRHQRAHAIQTVEQYIYLYDVITKELTGRQSALLKDEFRNYLSQLKSVNPGTGKQHIEEEFQLIEKLTPTFNEKRYGSAKAVNNLSKNRHNNVLPDDNYRLYLSRGDGDYINAIQLPDAQRPFGYILTQTPLPNTVGDFLSLVADHEVLSIVMFEHDQEETVGVYLPSKEGPILCDSFELFLHDQSELGDIDVLNMKFYDKQTEDARFINVFRGHFWKQNRLVPEDHQPMTDLIEAVLNLRKEHSGHPVLVHCMNGAKQSGMFCVLANLVEQIQLFGTVDILQTVVNMRHRRIQIVPCLAQLEYIYNFVENYLKTIGENRFNV
ncbi:receptor-type tyrosine-protein phosphatase alpha-like [Saccostrea cucullata]|uniref:receptor-type tyrosine-protein phosphatase alpha-like n=1 Tax=Saccostrea cuccullata TaxID=36930 RepID=UPI002ED2EA66